jgi:hypothetical protein
MSQGVQMFPLSTSADSEHGLQGNIVFSTQGRRSESRCENVNDFCIIQFCQWMILSFGFWLRGTTGFDPLIFLPFVLTVAFWKLFSNRFTFSAFTNPAPPASFSYGEVVSTQRVAVFAMSHPCAQGSQTVSAQDIFTLCNCFKMPRIYAKFVFAQVIDYKTFWDWTFVQCVAKSMGHHFADAVMNSGIAVLVRRIWVKPAIVWFSSALKIPQQPLETQVLHVA